MPSTYTVTIDQSAITAPNFPRSVNWWRGYLPIWFTHREDWKQNYADLVNDSITVDDSTRLVSVRVEDRHRADQIFRYLSSMSAFRRHMDNPDAAIRLVVGPTSEGTQAK
jgi:hypothetical protein